MKRFLICNVQKDFNFGGPSIIIGLCELFKSLYGVDFVAENIQAGYVKNEINGAIPLETKYYYLPSRKNFFKFLFGDKKCLSLFQLIRYIKKFDVIIDAYGICFCDKLDNRNMGIFKSRLMVLRKFTISILAKKILHKKVIKNVASYGPIECGFNKNSASYMSNKIFDIIAAREKKSREWIKPYAKNEVLVSPDVANMVKVKQSTTEDKIVISVSHMIKKQWRSKEDYITCMSAFCTSIIEKYNYRVDLLPNECNPNYYNDIDVARDIIKKVGGDRISIVPSERMTCLQMKQEIASSRIMVGSRYHSCVAALSAGVPIIVIGWHNKYKELMELYGQENWMIREDECDHNKLLDLFESLNEAYDSTKHTISERRNAVEQMIMNVAKEMYGVQL